MRRLAKAGALAVAALATGCADAALDALPAAGEGRVAAVDAVGRLRLEDGSAVRLAGVEGVDRAALAKLVEGRDVRLLRAGENDARHVSLKRGRVWVQGRLVGEGYARARPGPGEAGLAEDLLRREAQARQAKRGGWRGRWRVLTATEAEGACGFQIIEGRVRGVSTRRRGVFLDFGPNWRTDLSAEIPTDAVTAFERAGEGPPALQGRLVRIRGELRPGRFGPALQLTHPSALEVLDEP